MPVPEPEPVPVPVPEPVPGPGPAQESASEQPDRQAQVPEWRDPPGPESALERELAPVSGRVPVSD